MAGRASAAVVTAMRMVLDQGLTPYKAAHEAGIDISTIYKSRLYKAWRDAKGDVDQLATVRKLVNQA